MLRVIQWGTGNVGRHAVAAVRGHPDLRLVGTLVYIYPRSAGDRVVERLEAACVEGGTSFHGTGIEPGWAAEVLPLAMSPLFRRIDSLLVQELLDYSTYDSADMLFEIMGFGRAPGAAVPMSDPVLAGSVFRAPIMMVADGLGATGEDEADQGCLGTAMHAVHAIGPVCRAEPGIRTFLDLPMINGRHVFGAEQACSR
ncbi:hypothetical protein [Parafrankia elaeagni]|uniref:hypothetical protein n=1 Tax=Parafrankia elaeagni TaxID=222534 RepID=UPI00039A0836|nr:hypothetical protein [Parafrankia elaeagni]